MSKIGDMWKTLLSKLGLSKQPALMQGEEIPDGADKNEFSTRVKNIQISPEQQQMQEKETAKKAAYNCLAEMVVNQEFDDKTFLNMSMNKGMHRLQVEKRYVDYGHGEEVPVSDSIIRVYREIQRTMYEKTKFIAGYGLAHDAELEQLISGKNLNLGDILMEGGEKISTKVLSDFQNQGHSITEFNSYSDEGLAKTTMKNAIVKAFNDYIQEKGYNR